MKIFNIYLNGVYFDTLHAYDKQHAIDCGELYYARDTDIVTAREINPDTHQEESETTSNDSEGSC